MPEHPPRTIWMTGLSASGKTTLGTLLVRSLANCGEHAYLLDGDQIRSGLCADLGFSLEDRAENIRRVAYLARTLNDAGVSAVCCCISPTEEIRELARSIVRPHPFIEVYLDTPLSICEARDPKGLYARARSGELTDFTGISGVYEPPVHSVVRVSTHVSDPQCCLAEIIAEL